MAFKVLKALLWLSCLFIIACSVNETNISETDIETWAEWNQASEDGYVKDDLAVLKAVDYRYIPVGTEIFVSERDGGFALTMESTDGYRLKAKLESGFLVVTSDTGKATYAYADLPVLTALSDTQRLRLNLENITHDEKRVRAILYDDNADALKNFPGLTFFPYDVAGIITASFDADPDMPEVILDTERGLTKAFYRAGYANFALNGEDYKMPLYTGTTNPDQINSFFTGFVDETTGAETYGTGRYVPISDFGVYPPETVEIDFNYSYNPYCARSGAYNCPVISFAINAPMRFGESYGKKE